MKKLILTSFAIVFGLQVIAQTTLVNYNFNTPPTAYPVSPDANASGITGSLTGSETFQTYTGVATGSSAFTSNTTSGSAVAMQISSGTNTKYFLLHLNGSNMSLYSGVIVYFQSQRSTTGAQTITIATSTDGTNYTTQSTTVTVPTSYGESLIALTGISNSSDVYIKLLASNATGTGTLRIDNLEVQGTVAQNAFTTSGTSTTFNGLVTAPTVNVTGNLTGGATTVSSLTSTGALSAASLTSSSLAGTGNRYLMAGSGGNIITQSTSTSWDLGGNANGGVQNFGTKDGNDLVFIAGGNDNTYASIERMRLTATGRLSLGGANANPGAMLEIRSNNSTDYGLIISNQFAHSVFTVLPNGATNIFDQDAADVSPLFKITHSNGSTLQFLANGSGDITASTSLRPHFGSSDFTIFEGVPGTGQQRFAVTTGGGAIIQTNHSTVGSATALSIINSTVAVGSGYSASGIEKFSVKDDGTITTSSLAGQGVRTVLVDNTGKLTLGMATTSTTTDWTVGGNNITNPATEFIGTLSQNPFNIWAGNAPQISVRNDGKTVVGNSALTVTDKFNVTDVAPTGFTIYSDGVNSGLAYESKMTIANGYGEVDLKQDASGVGRLMWSGSHILSFHGENVLIGEPANNTDVGDINTKLTITTATANGYTGFPLKIFNPTISTTKAIFEVLTDGTTHIGQKTSIGNHADALLSVYGKALFTSAYVNVSSAVWSDYVFEKNYSLIPLNEVESYYKQNKHLPGVPSAKEMEKTGDNVVETDAMLLKKIEELTLYMVELQKQIKELKDSSKK